MLESCKDVLAPRAPVLDTEGRMVREPKRKRRELLCQGAPDIAGWPWEGPLWWGSGEQPPRPPAPHFPPSRPPAGSPSTQLVLFCDTRLGL